MNLHEMKMREHELKSELRELKYGLMSVVADSLDSASAEEIKMLATYAAHSLAKTGADPRGLFGREDWAHLRNKFS